MAYAGSIAGTGVSNKALWTGRVLSGLASLFLLMDALGKLAKPVPVVEATTKLGYPEGTITGIGVLLLACTVLYLVPRTAVLGAVLLTGFLGGAVATNVRVEAPAFNLVFSVLMGAMLWGGLLLRESRLRALFLRP